MCARWTRARDDRVSSNRGHLVRRWRGVHVVWRGCRFGRGYAVGAAYRPAGGRLAGAGLRRWRRSTSAEGWGGEQRKAFGNRGHRVRRWRGVHVVWRDGRLGRGYAVGAAYASVGGRVARAGLRQWRRSARRPRGGAASSAWCSATVDTGYAGGAVCTSSGGGVGSGAGTRWAPRAHRLERGSSRRGTRVTRCARRPEGWSAGTRVRGGRRTRVGAGRGGGVARGWRRGVARGWRRGGAGVDGARGRCGGRRTPRRCRAARRTPARGP